MANAAVGENSVGCVVVQGGNDPQTEADRKAQRCIVASLTKKFPEINVQGEEVSYLNARLSGELDPLF